MSANADARPEKRVPTRYDVLPVFVERWSPRSFLERRPSAAQLRSMFEAARLAPSAHNTQPPRFILTEKGRGDGHARLFDCLDPHNQVWAHAAPVLVLALLDVAPEEIAADYELSAGMCNDADAVTEGLTRAGTTARAELLRALEALDLDALVASDLRAALRARLLGDDT